MSIFQSFRSTVNGWVRGERADNYHVLEDPNTGAPVGLQSKRGNGAQGVWVPIDLTAAQIADPSDDMLDDLNAMYRLDVEPHTRYYSNGNELVPFGSGFGTTISALTSLASPFNNLRVNPVMAVPPIITDNGTTDATLTNIVLWDDDDASVVNLYGGAPIDTGVGFVRLGCVTTSVGGPLAGYAGRAEVTTDAVKIQFKLLNSGNQKIRFIVDNQYVSYTPLALGLATRYVVLDFTESGGAKLRTIMIEMAALNFASVAVGPTDSLVKPQGDPLRAVVVGDSFTGGGGVTFNPLTYNQYMGDLLGIRDMWGLGVGATGFTVSTPSGLTYIDRISDVVAAAPDIAFITGWHNDNGADPGDLADAVQLYMRTFRQQSVLKNIPVVFLGISQGNEDLTDYQATEAAVLAGVEAHNDPLVFFVPGANRDAGPYWTGTGSTLSPTGTGNCDIYISTDEVHPNEAGHAYLAQVVAADIIRIVYGTSAITDAALQSTPLGYGVIPSGGLLSNVIAWSPLIVNSMPGITVQGTLTVRTMPA